MKKKKIITSGLITIALIGSIFAYVLIADRVGEDKYTRAITELRASEPRFDNPCLGTSVLRSYSSIELSKKSIAEIKELAKKDPGSC